MTHPSQQRLDRLRQSMRAEGADLVALAPGSHMDWLLGFHPHPDERPCLLMIGPEREAFLMPALNAEGTRESTDIAFHGWADADGPQAALASALADVGAAAARNVVLDETMRADFALMLLDALPDASHAFTEATLGRLRMVKDAAEIDLLQMNAAIADRAMGAAFAAIRPGASESDIAGVIKDHFLSEGASPAFWIVGSGPNGAFPHHQTGERRLAEGDAIVIDIGGRRQGFPSDITRMAAVGRAPEGYAEVHAVVERAVQAALAAARPGVTARTVDAAARTVIADAGYGDHFVHRTGHGIGIDIHEPPYITSTSETVLEAGMSFSIEPGIYLPGRFGIRLEEIVVLRDDGPRILSGLSRELRIA